MVQTQLVKFYFNLEPNIDPTRINESNIDVNTKKFRSKIRTRYDRIEEEPTTRLDYSIKEPELPGMVKMEKVIDRH